MADVTFKRQEYVDALPEWTLNDDVCGGERSIKSKGKAYLPEVGDPAEEGAREKYERYLYRACFFGVTSRTLQSLVGAVFKKTPVCDVTLALEYVAHDVDGEGNSIYQQSQSVLSKIMKRGRHGLLVDYPKIENESSKAELAKDFIRASIVSIEASQIINWRTTKIGGVFRLSLVVIKEVVTSVTADGFGLEAEDQYRVLKLDSGVYVVELWRKDKDGKLYVYDEYTPTKGSGEYWNEIPFTFVGATNNDHSIDSAPLSELARLNLHHYHNSADFEHAAFFQGHGQAWMSGLDEEYLKLLQDNGITVGADQLMAVPSGEQFGIAQTTSELVVMQAMNQKYDYMVSVGARIIQPGGAVKTATEAQSDSEAEYSVLSLAASNVSDAYTQSIYWMGEFMKATSSSSSYKLNTDLTPRTLDPQTLTAYQKLVDGDLMPVSDFWEILRKTGDIDPSKTDEQIKEEIDGQSRGLGLDS